MNTTKIMTAADAINRSISHNEIVHVADIGTVREDLLVACEDYDDAVPGQTDFWGEDDDGHAWRVVCQ